MGSGDAHPRATRGERIRYIYGPGGTVVAQIGGSNDRLCSGLDQLGSTRSLTDGTGTLVGTFTYDSYGALVGKTGTTTSMLDPAAAAARPVTTGWARQRLVDAGPSGLIGLGGFYARHKLESELYC